MLGSSPTGVIRSHRSTVGRWFDTPDIEVQLLLTALQSLSETDHHAGLRNLNFGFESRRDYLGCDLGSAWSPKSSSGVQFLGSPPASGSWRAGGFINRDAPDKRTAWVRFPAGRPLRPRLGRPAHTRFGEGSIPSVATRTTSKAGLPPRSRSLC